MGDLYPLRRAGLLVLLLALVCAPGIYVLAHGIASFSWPWWEHLAGTVLPFYLANTLVVAPAAIAFAFLAGGVPAWLTARYDFPGRAGCVFLQLLPLTFPAYVAAGFYLEAWSSPFFESRGALALELGAATAPFVFLFVRVALARLPASLIEAAAALGAGPLERFGRVVLPLLAAPLIAAAALVTAETVSDFGAAHRVGIATFTVGLHQQWFALQHPGLATMLSLVLLAITAVLAAPIIYLGLRGQRAHSSSATPVLAPRRPSLAGTLAIHSACLLAVVPGFWTPLALTTDWAARRIDRTDLSLLFPDVGGTLLTALATVAVCLTLTALFVLVLETGERARGSDRSVWLVVLNFLTPSLVLATAWLAAGISGRAVIVMAIAVKLLPLLLLPVADVLARMPAALVESARSLGCSRLAAIRRVVLPQLPPALAAGMLLVFVLAATELTFSLTLQPFGYNALSLRVYAAASLYQTRAASVWTIGLIIVSIYPIWRLSRLVDAPRGHHD
jgi:iron(III) transport system permease protein